LGFDGWGCFRPIKIVGGEDGDDEDSDAESIASPLFNMGG